MNNNNKMPAEKNCKQKQKSLTIKIESEATVFARHT